MLMLNCMPTIVSRKDQRWICAASWLFCGSIARSAERCQRKNALRIACRMRFAMCREHKIDIVYVWDASVVDSYGFKLCMHYTNDGVDTARWR
jgi:hypothetical protein